ncbi:hypothetical protein AMTRI_Chr12g240690 [Amborella trichopoda]
MVRSVLFLVCFHFCIALGIEEANGPRVVNVNVGVILALDSWVGRVSNLCITMALEDFYKEHPNHKTRILLSRRDSGLDVVQTASAALDLLKNVEVAAILGPQLSAEAEFLAELGNKSQVPILSFSATSPFLSSTRTPYFVRATIKDSAQAKPIAALLRAYGWRQAVAISENTKYCIGFIPYLIDAVEEIGSHIRHKIVIASSASEEFIGEEILKLVSMKNRVFIIHMSSVLASRFFWQVQQLGYMSEEYAWIITDGFTSLLDSMDPSVIASMQGVLGVKAYVEESKQLAKFTTRWKHRYRAEYPNEIQIPHLNVFGLRAYDTTWALALAMEKSVTKVVSLRQPITPIVARNPLDFYTPQISPVGRFLLKAILNTQFEGLTSNIQFIDGELEVSNFQIINIVGQSIREIGFWTPEFGLSQVIKQETQEKKKVYMTRVTDLKMVIWPGESVRVPRGWMFPTNGGKLKIAVPVKIGFQEFVKVERDLNNQLTVTGFSVVIFKAVLDALPYDVPYEFVPVEISHGRRIGTYNDLVYQVYLGTYDAVVGDVTITANRSNYVDFTPPYSKPGVSMVVPMQKERRSRAWVFLKPLTRELWSVTACCFIFMAFVVWSLEHRVNDYFQGTPMDQLGKALYFSFSALVFSHCAKVNNNLTRFVLVLWLFVVLIISQSYTANLASILTVEQLEPTITDVQTLIENGDYVGYHDDSFVEGMLKKLGIAKSKIKGFNTSSELAKALRKSSANGGVSAIFLEIPYIKVFLTSYHDEFSMAGPIFRTGGFGYVFQKNSPLLSDISKAVLEVTEDEKMKGMEMAWLGSRTVQPTSSTDVASNGLSLDCFWGLFLLVSTTSIAALIIFFIQICKEDHNNETGEAKVTHQSIWRRTIAAARHFSEKHPSLHYFRRKERT